jgi:diguanylate cyclase (GGDEF)-like protein
MRAIFSGRRFSLRKVLRWLVLACVLPATLVSVALVVSVYQLELKTVQQSTLLTAQNVMSDLEREMSDTESGVQNPATAAPVGANPVPGQSPTVGLDPVHMATVINRQQLPQGWLVAVLDRSGTIIGRSRDAERYIGKKAMPEVISAAQSRAMGSVESKTMEGIPVFTAFARSNSRGWTVVVGAPKSALEGSNRRQGFWVLMGVACAMGLGLWLARAISMRVLASVHLLNEAAASLSRGEEVRLPKMQMMEADAVGRAMVDAAVAMQKIRFFAEHDTLTELPNRLLFETVVNRDLALAERHPSHSALLAVDLDKFKQVNDTQGHETGDTVLRLAAKRIQQVIRVSDIAARIGGDEFLVFLGDTTEDGAMETARRIVELLSSPYGSLDIPVSASVGVALFPDHGASLRELSAAADAALYQAKRAGRKRAVQVRSDPAD